MRQEKKLFIHVDIDRRWGDWEIGRNANIRKIKNVSSYIN
jgi:hypothetical protein